MSKGFTLIEIMVVLSIIALVMGFGGPKIVDFYEKYQRNFFFDQLDRGFRELPIKVFARHKDVELKETKDFQKYVNFGKGIELEAQKPLKIRRDGFCTGGEVFLKYKGKKYFLEPTPPYCELLEDPKEIVDQ